MTQSSKTSIAVQWDSVTVPSGQESAGGILGYKLTVTDPLNGTTWEAFDGVSLGTPAQTFTIVNNLITGRDYLFEVAAYNFNGIGVLSDSQQLYSCILPTEFNAPVRTDSTTSSISISWEPPGDDGGCVLTGFAVFIDDGTGSANFVEANQDDDTALRNQPGLNQATITRIQPGSIG